MPLHSSISQLFKESVLLNCSSVIRNHNLGNGVLNILKDVLNILRRFYADRAANLSSGSDAVGVCRLCSELDLSEYKSANEFVVTLLTFLCAIRFVTCILNVINLMKACSKLTLKNRRTLQTSKPVLHAINVHPRPMPRP